MNRVNRSPRLNNSFREAETELRAHAQAIDQLQPRTVTTQALPDPAPELDGRSYLEDTGSTVNLVVYANGKRYRFAGVEIA